MPDILGKIVAQIHWNGERVVMVNQLLFSQRFMVLLVRVAGQPYLMYFGHVQNRMLNEKNENWLKLNRQTKKAVRVAAVRIVAQA